MAVPGSGCASFLMPGAEEWSSRLGWGEGLVPAVGGGGLGSPATDWFLDRKKRHLALIISEYFCNLNAFMIP